jgi:hypothetical protein
MVFTAREKTAKFMILNNLQNGGGRHRVAKRNQQPETPAALNHDPEEVG